MMLTSSSLLFVSVVMKLNFTCSMLLFIQQTYSANEKNNNNNKIRINNK